MYKTVVLTIFSVSLYPEIKSQCAYTNSKGPQKNVACVFPFRFKEMTYSNCTKNFDPDGLFWCSTKVDENGKHMGGIDAWGYCDNQCDQKENSIHFDAKNHTNSVNNQSTANLPPIKRRNKKRRNKKNLNASEKTISVDPVDAGLFTVSSSALRSKGAYLPDPEKFECGVSLDSGSVMGGTEAKKGRYPFIAALGYNTPSGKMTYDCGGSLINRYYVLTAAHCHLPLRPIVKVILGAHDFDSDKDCNGCDLVQRFDIQPEDVTVHERFNVSEIDSIGYDIALIRLPRPVMTPNENYNENVLPICISWNEEELSPNNAIIGWGRTNNNLADVGNRHKTGVFSGILRQLFISDFPFSECKQYHFANLDPQKHICAGGVQGRDSCKGDSGGPLISMNPNNNFMYLKGIVSFGTKLCGRGAPGVYTNLAFYKEWILANMKP